MYTHYPNVITFAWCYSGHYSIAILAVFCSHINKSTHLCRRMCDNILLIRYPSFANCLDFTLHNLKTGQVLFLIIIFTCQSELICIIIFLNMIVLNVSLICNDA